MPVLVVSGTGTEIGKTVVTAAVAAVALAAGRSVAVLKPAQTGVAPGEPGDVFEVRRLAGEAVTGLELARFPEPLAPDTAARRAGMAPVHPQQIAEAAGKLATEHDLVLVEGAGGLLVRFDEEGATRGRGPAAGRPGSGRDVCRARHTQHDRAHLGGPAGTGARVPRGGGGQYARRAGPGRPLQSRRSSGGGGRAAAGRGARRGGGAGTRRLPCPGRELADGGAGREPDHRLSRGA